jgi:hypothetical protein
VCEFLTGARRLVEAGDIGPIDAEEIDDLPITGRMLGVNLVGSRRI